MSFVGFVFIAALLCVVFETFSIQMDEYNPEFKTNSKYNKKIPVRISKRTPRMGDILDMNGISMVTSISFFDIYMDPTVPSKEVFDSEITDLCEKLSELFPEDIDQRDFENKVRNARERDQKYLLVRKKVTNEQRNRIKEFPIFKLGRNFLPTINAEILIMLTIIISLLFGLLIHLLVENRFTKIINSKRN